jgi:putative serine protease PepD
VGRDPLTDLAVIRVDKSDLQTITIGNSSGLKIGQPVVALGAPLGLSSTVTSGIVSALGRTVHVPGEGSGSALLVEAVQTDASINPGNSGGALVNCSGALIGIPTAGASTGETGGSIGLGFAIPVNSAITIADEIISKGSVTHAFIGVQAQPLSASATGQGGQAAGLWIVAVVPGSPAASAGLQEGDIIRSIDGDPATSTDQLMAVTLTKRPGDRVEVGYERDGKQSTATITLSSRSSTS